MFYELQVRARARGEKWYNFQRVEVNSKEDSPGDTFNNMSKMYRKRARKNGDEQYIIAMWDEDNHEVMSILYARDIGGRWKKVN